MSIETFEITPAAPHYSEADWEGLVDMTSLVDHEPLWHETVSLAEKRTALKTIDELTRDLDSFRLGYSAIARTVEIIRSELL